MRKKTRCLRRKSQKKKTQQKHLSMEQPVNVRSLIHQLVQCLEIIIPPLVPARSVIEAPWWRCHPFVNGQNHVHPHCLLTNSQRFIGLPKFKNVAIKNYISNISKLVQLNQHIDILKLIWLKLFGWFLERWLHLNQFWYCWGRNPAPPGMYKSLCIMG